MKKQALIIISAGAAVIVAALAYLLGMGIEQISCDVTWNEAKYRSCHTRLDARFNDVPTDPVKASQYLYDLTHVQ